MRNGDDAMPVAVWSRPISIANTKATLVRLTDLSIHRRAEQIAAAERFARSVLEQATEAVVVLSPDGHITHASWRAEQLADAAAGRPHLFRGVSARSAEHGRGGSFGAFLRREPRHHAGDQAVSRRRSESCAANAPPNPPSCSSAGPLVDDNKANVGSIVTLTDMTERKRAEEQQVTMMVAELNHRVKNILAIVQSVAAQTVRSSSSLENFADAFTGRLKALAIAHDILTQTRWIGIGLSELLAAVLAPYRSPDETRVSISGPAILLPARAVVPLSMVLHEMTTNAVKYGALSTRRGIIKITWQVSGGVEKSVELVWQEGGGPKVKAARSTGFGTKLIDHVIRHDLDGNTKIDFDPAGVRWTITFPISGMARGGAAAPGSSTA